MKNLKLIVAVTMISTPALAGHIHHYGCGHTYGQSGCLVDDRVLLDTEIEKFDECILDKELKLREGLFNYPLLKDSPYTVQYWQGSYKKPTLYKSRYMRYVTNVCTQKVIFEGEFVERTTKYVRFFIQNPNTDSKIDKTYLLVPMTRKEARASMESIKRECETSN